MTKLKKWGIYAGIIGTILLCVRYCGRQRPSDAETLPAGDKARVVIDSKHHKLVELGRNPITGKEERKETFLPPRSDVEIRKDGTVIVNAKQWGPECVPFIGGGIGSDLKARAALGLNLLYVKQWELGGGLLLNQDIRDTRVFVHAGYNLYSSFVLSLGVDNKRTVYLLGSLKF